MEAQPCIGDIEASGLGPESYPIEIAWSLPDGSIHSSLIQTDSRWGEDWEIEAQELHHITPVMLLEQGLPALEVAKKMNEELAGEQLYFDGGHHDLFWLTILFRAADMQPSFGFRDFDTLLAAAGAIDGNKRVTAEAWAERDFAELGLQRHRAANDVKFLQRWYIRARGGVRT